MTGLGEAPIEYVNYVLMRRIFHCTPSELRAETIEDIQNVLTCANIEAEVREWKEEVRRNTPQIP